MKVNMAVGDLRPRSHQAKYITIVQKGENLITKKYWSERSSADKARFLFLTIDSNFVTAKWSAIN